MTHKVHPYAQGASVLARRLGGENPPERRGAVSWEIPAGGNCESPVAFSHTYRGGYTPAERARRARDGDRSLFVDGEGRCRRCGPCLRYRRRLWAARAAHELQVASRTWWGTLTQGPRERFTQLAEAQAIANKSLVYWHTLSEREQFDRLVRVLGGRVQRFLKRLRKGGARVRYLMIAEPHESGDPHIHMLLHEISAPVRKAVLEAQWADGFSKWKLVGSTHDDCGRVASYITKYMLEEKCARPRASLHYGSASSVVASELPEKAASSPETPEGGRLKAANSLPLPPFVFSDQG